jgi:hypothetical protein
LLDWLTHLFFKAITARCNKFHPLPNNDLVTFQKLIEPLQKLARNQTDQPYTLAVIDWSMINDDHHEAKKD